jgi:signal transduction histidine kinase
LTLKTASFDLREMLSRALDGFRQKADAKSLSLVLDVAPELAIDVAGDPIRIRQVIKNLLSNAVKFTAAGGVHLRARLLKAFSDRVVVRIEVEDTGIGIPLDEQAGLFEPFFQVDPSFTRNFGGTGLGLAIVKLLLERMGGQVGVESQPNKGSRFWFSLCLRRSCGDGSPLK